MKLIYGAAIVSSLSGIGGAFAWSAYTPKPAAPAAPVPQGAGAAQIAALDFLNERPFTVPVAQGVPADPRGASAPSDGSLGTNAPLQVDAIALVSSQTPAGLSDKGGKVQNYELDTFDVRTGGKLVQVTVTMLLTDSGPVLGALPSVQSVSGPANAPAGLDYQTQAGASGSNVAASVQSVLSQWASAYAAAGPDNPNLDQGLREVAQTNTAPGFYTGMDGLFTVQSVNVITAVQTSSGLGVRLRVAYTSTATKQYQMTADYDLVVVDPDTTVPKVTKWGPAGTLPELLTSTRP